MGEVDTRRLRSPGFVLVLALALLFCLHAHRLSFTSDDAYISLRYAKNLTGGAGLVFNPGERVEGYSNPSWTLLLALLLRAGLPPVEWARWIGILCAAGAVLVAGRLGRALEGRWGPVSVGAAALVAGNSALAMWSTGGLETGLFVLLIAAALERGLAPGVSAGGRRLAVGLFVLAALTRPDAPLIFAIWIAVRAVRAVRGPRDDTLRRCALDAVLFVAALAPFLLWKLRYYGDVVPNTFHAKAGFSATYLHRGLDELRSLFQAYGFGGASILAAAVAVIAPLSGASRPALRGLAAVCAGFAAYVVVIGGDVLPGFRFWLPILPAAAVLISAGIRRLEIAARGRGVPAPVARAVSIAAIAALVVGGIARNGTAIADSGRALDHSAKVMRGIGEWLGARLAPGESIACTAIGAMAYYSDRPVLDMLGLTDREIARHPDPIEGLRDTWREKKYNASSVLRRRPGAIVFSTGVRPSSTAEKALFLYEDFHRSYYALEFRLSPASTGVETVYRLRPDAPPPGKPGEPASPGFLEEYARGLSLQSPPDRDLAAAEAAFARADELGPPSFHSAAEWRATLMFDRGAPGAVAALREVVARDSLALRASLRLGAALARDGDVGAAETLYRRVLAANPDEPLAWHGLAEIVRGKGDVRAALAMAERGLRLWSTNVPGAVQCANLRLLAGDAPGAERLYREILRVRPGLEAAERGLAMARRASGEGASRPADDDGA